MFAIAGFRFSRSGELAGIDLLRALLTNRIFAAAPGWNDEQWSFAEFDCSPAQCAELFREGLIVAEPVSISDEVLAAHGVSREQCGPITHEWMLTERGRRLAQQ